MAFRLPYFGLFRNETTEHVKERLEKIMNGLSFEPWAFRERKK